MPHSDGRRLICQTAPPPLMARRPDVSQPGPGVPVGTSLRPCQWFWQIGGPAPSFGKSESGTGALGAMPGLLRPWAGPVLPGGICR